MSEPRVAQLEALLRKSSERNFSENEIAQLLRYYQLVLKWNRRLHLTTLTQPEPFFQRHISESAMAEAHLLKTVRQLWDLGSGLGVPGLPLAILRPDLRIHLVESARNKALFLEEAVAALELANVQVIGARTESLAELSDDTCLTARAIEEMEQMLAEILRIGESGAQMLILATERVRKAMDTNLSADWIVQTYPIAGTDRSLLINATRST